jgi:P pilus assembly chaperone PapD
MKKTFFKIVLIIVSVFSLGIITARAEMSFMVSPLRVEHQVKAGANETNVIQVANTGSEPTRVAVHMEDWTMDRKGDVRFSPAGGDPASCMGWIQLNPVDFRLDPGQTRQVRYSLTVPADAGEGGYRAAIILEGMPRQEEGPAKKRMGLRGRIVVMAYATIGNPEIKAEFQDFQVTALNKGVSFKLTFANQGNVHFRIKKSWIVVKNTKGEDVGRVEVPDIPVLQGAIRELEFKKEDLALPKGNYVAEAILDVGKEDFLGRKSSFSVSR